MNKKFLATILASQISFVYAATDSTLLPSDYEISSGPSGSASQTVDASANQEQAQAAAMLPSSSVLNLGNTNTQFSQVNSRMFGAQLFKGAFASSAGSTFNQSYVINPGDNINLRLWGAYQFSGSLTVDPQGNIFVPNVGLESFL